MSGRRDILATALLVLTLVACDYTAVSSSSSPLHSLIAMSHAVFNCSNHATVDLCVKCPKGSFANESTFQSEMGQSKCQPCQLGTFCPNDGCVHCFPCLWGHEATLPGSSKCTECKRGYFKPKNDSDLCMPCPAGHFANNTGQTKCISCPSGHFCPMGCYDPFHCNSSEICPPGSGSSKECDHPLHVKQGGECKISTTFIVIICVISVPVVVTVLAIIIYKLCKHCRRQHLYSDAEVERQPLLSGSRPSSRIQEPVYSGL